MPVRINYVPEFVFDNLDTLNFDTKLVDVNAIVKASGLSRSSIKALIKGLNKPTIAPYNAIAEFMHWRKWEISKGGEK